MARSASVALPPHKMSQCYLCGSPAVQPKLLPCLHTFCLRCLESVELQRPHGSAKWCRLGCPKCSTEFEVPRQGLLGLPSDIFVERLVRIQKGLCDVCSDDESCKDTRVPSASKYCPLCSQGLCEPCAVEHSRQKLLKAHTLVDFRVETALEEARLHPSNVCTKHPTVLSTQFFCQTCLRFVCNVCLLEDHMQHAWTKWEEAIDKLKNDLKLNISQVSGLLGDVVKRREEAMDSEIRRLNNKTNNVDSLIRDRCRKLRDLIDRHENALLAELKELEDTRSVQIKEELDAKFGRYLIQLETYENFCSAVTKSGSPNEVDWAVNDLNLPERCEQLRKQYDVLTNSSSRLSSSFEVSFEPPDEDAILTNRATVGMIISQTVAGHGGRFDTRGKEAWGVTSMDKYIYILSDESVLIFDPQNPSKPVNEIDIPQKNYLTDIAASPVDRCLYVTDQGNSNALIKESRIWKIEEKTPDTFQVSKWLAVYIRLFTLSVSPKGHVTVPLSAKTANKLSVYSTDGKSMNTIILPTEIEFPNHAVELSNGNFVVAFGKSVERQHGVCEINVRGEPVTNYCYSYLGLVLNHPWHVMVFSNEEILLADSKNNRVLWLDSGLDVKKVLLTKERDGIIEPRRMCYAKQSNLLIIVHREDGKGVVNLHDASRWLN